MKLFFPIIRINYTLEMSILMHENVLFPVKYAAYVRGKMLKQIIRQRLDNKGNMF